jgi:hypothetical protein
VGSDYLRRFALNAPVRQADFSPPLRRESSSAPNMRDENASGDAALCETMQKSGGPAGRRPSSVNQEVAGSSPTRGANFQAQLRRAGNHVRNTGVNHGATPHPPSRPSRSDAAASPAAQWRSA